jgi:hypothetical protein
MAATFALCRMRLWERKSTVAWVGSSKRGRSPAGVSAAAMMASTVDGAPTNSLAAPSRLTAPAGTAAPPGKCAVPAGSRQVIDQACQRSALRRKGAIFS